MKNSWFVIINPTSGNGTAKKMWPKIYNELVNQDFKFNYVFTKYAKHSQLLVQEAIEKGYNTIICVGGDGTLHNIVNGVLNCKIINALDIKIGIIPIGTGNDWIKTYNISKNYKSAIKTLKVKNTCTQDIGKITILNTNKVIYFNNLAGIGFDGFIINNINKYKYLGFLAYLTAALISLKKYKNTLLTVSINSDKIKVYPLMLLIGIGKYCGGGLQLTNSPNSTDGLFDISVVNSISLGTIISNFKKLFNGKITSHKAITNYKSDLIKVEVISSTYSFIQADGELIGTGSFICELLPKSINFIVP
jgi:YegS/Rv2252/BmrU family lipid kinase